MSNQEKSKDLNFTVAIEETGTQSRTESQVRRSDHLCKVIRVKDAPSYIGVSRSHYHNLRNEKSPYYQEDFPEIVQLSFNCKGHLKSDLDNWLESRLVQGGAS